MNRPWGIRWRNGGRPWSRTNDDGWLLDYQHEKPMGFATNFHATQYAKLSFGPFGKNPNLVRQPGFEKWSVESIKGEGQ